MSWLLIAACSIYVVTIAYGIWAGDALPTTTIFRLVPTIDLTILESVAPYSILCIAASGSAFAWLAALRLMPEKPLRRAEVALMRIWRWWGLPVIACLYLFSLSAGGWSGHVREIDQNYMSLAGLVPNSDARGYFTDAFRQALGLGWDQMGSRRPIAEAFRHITVFVAQYSYVDTLLVQLGLLVLASFSATCAIATWRGIWAAFAFIGLITILVRSFLATTLTEPLALIWAMFSLVFLIEALRRQSLPHALIGISGLTVALLTRMGSLFTIPLLVVWATVVSAQHSYTRFNAFAFACCTVLATGTISLMLSYFYGSPGILTGGNFAWTACGLSIGTDWLDCHKMYQSEFAQFSTEREVAWFLISQSWQNFVLQPYVLLQKLYINMDSFFSTLPSFLLAGYPAYTRSPNVLWLPNLLLLPGLIYVLGWRASRAERLLWLAFAISIPMSAAVVLADDGWRVLYATHVFIVCFFALGFAAPGVVTIPNSMATAWSWRGGAAVIMAMGVLFIIIPELSRVLIKREIAAYPAFQKPTNSNEEQIVLGGKRLTGFLVIPDTEPRSSAIPAIHLSQFVRLVSITRLEDDFGPFLQEMVGRTPFALVVSAGRLDAENQSNIYLAPPTVLEQRHAWAWRFVLRVRHPSEVPWHVLREVIAAEKLP
jgi:hypothetical protein